MAAYSKVLLSGSTFGKPVKVAATATPGTSVHATGTSASIQDEIWLYAYNSDTASRVLTIEFGGATAPDQNIVSSIASKTGLTMVIPGLVLTGDGGAALTVKAFADAANVVTVSGFVNRIT